MVIHLLAAGNKLPPWIASGYDEYAKRMPRECRLQLEELPLLRRGRGHSPEEIKRKEGERMLQTIEAIQPRPYLVALDSQGREWSTEELSRQLGRWLQSGGNVALLIGGPDGLSAECLARADAIWSLSALTFPHHLVRVVVAEQIYRAWTLLQGHPYHKGH